jgi:hypothetical protein
MKGDFNMIYYVYCKVCDYDDKFLVKADTSKEAINKVYKHYKNTGVAGFRGLDENGYYAILKNRIKANKVDELLKNKDICGMI